MKNKYIYEQDNWQQFKFDDSSISLLLNSIAFEQGKLINIIDTLGLDIKNDTILESVTSEIVKSSEIEGEILDRKQVRSSIAKRLNLKHVKKIANTSKVDGAVEILIDATTNYNKPLTIERLYAWHSTLFPTGYSGLYKINVGKYRDDATGRMQVVSNKGKREIIHYIAPEAEKVPQFINQFLDWVNNTNNINPLIKVAISHIWFLTIHPFDDGNGRIARAITELLLARSESTPFRPYSLSKQIQLDKNNYYDILEKVQNCLLNTTIWVEWFLNCLLKAIQSSDKEIQKALTKDKMWKSLVDITINDSQRKIINMLFDGFDGNLTSSKYAKICKCSQDTATRSLNYLVDNNVLIKAGAGRSTHYILNIK